METWVTGTEGQLYKAGFPDAFHVAHAGRELKRLRLPFSISRERFTFSRRQLMRVANLRSGYYVPVNRTG